MLPPPGSAAGRKSRRRRRHNLVWLLPSIEQVQFPKGPGSLVVRTLTFCCLVSAGTAWGNARRAHAARQTQARASAAPAAEPAAPVAAPSVGGGSASAPAPASAPGPASAPDPAPAVAPAAAPAAAGGKRPVARMINLEEGSEFSPLKAPRAGEMGERMLLYTRKKATESELIPAFEQCLGAVGLFDAARLMEYRDGAFRHPTGLVAREASLHLYRKMKETGKSAPCGTFEEFHPSFVNFLRRLSRDDTGADAALAGSPVVEPPSAAPPDAAPGAPAKDSGGFTKEERDRSIYDDLTLCVGEQRGNVPLLTNQQARIGDVLVHYEFYTRASPDVPPLAATALLDSSSVTEGVTGRISKGKTFGHQLSLGRGHGQRILRAAATVSATASAFRPAEGTKLSETDFNTNLTELELDDQPDGDNFEVKSVPLMGVYSHIKDCADELCLQMDRSRLDGRSSAAFITAVWADVKRTVFEDRCTVTAGWRAAVANHHESRLGASSSDRYGGGVSDSDSSDSESSDEPAPRRNPKPASKKGKSKKSKSKTTKTHDKDTNTKHHLCLNWAKGEHGIGKGCSGELKGGGKCHRRHAFKGSEEKDTKKKFGKCATHPFCSCRVPRGACLTRITLLSQHAGGCGAKRPGLRAAVRLPAPSAAQVRAVLTGARGKPGAPCRA